MRNNHISIKNIFSVLLVLLLSTGLMGCSKDEPIVEEMTDDEIVINQNTDEIVFLEPSGLFALDNKKLFVVDKGLNAVFEIVNLKNNKLSGEIIAGFNGMPIGGYSDGFDQEVLFNHPTGIIEWFGHLVVSDTDNNSIRIITNNETQTLTGVSGDGFVDGHVNQAKFNHPTALAVDDEGLIYVADTGNNAIRTISKEGQVKTIISNLDVPKGLSYYDGLLYITCSGDNSIYTWDGKEIKLLSGTQDEIGGYDNGSLEEASFCAPSAILANEYGIFISDTANSMVRMIKDGQVTTIAEYNESGDDLWPAMPSGLAMIDNVLYVADEFAGVVFAIEIK